MLATLNAENNVITIGEKCIKLSQGHIFSRFSSGKAAKLIAKWLVAEKLAPEDVHVTVLGLHQ